MVTWIFQFLSRYLAAFGCRLPTRVQSPCSDFIKINCVVGGYGVRPLAGDGTRQAPIWYTFQEAEMRGSCWCLWSLHHSGIVHSSLFPSPLYSTSSAADLLGWERNFWVHPLHHPLPSFCFCIHPSSQSHDKTSMVSPPTTQLLFFSLVHYWKMVVTNHQSFFKCLL